MLLSVLGHFEEDGVPLRDVSTLARSAPGERRISLPLFTKWGLIMFMIIADLVFVLFACEFMVRLLDAPVGWRYELMCLLGAHLRRVQHRGERGLGHARVPVVHLEKHGERK